MSEEHPPKRTEPGVIPESSLRYPFSDQALLALALVRLGKENPERAQELGAKIMAEGMRQFLLNRARAEPDQIQGNAQRIRRHFQHLASPSEELRLGPFTLTTGFPEQDPDHQQLTVLASGGLTIFIKRLLAQNMDREQQREFISQTRNQLRNHGTELDSQIGAVGTLTGLLSGYPFIAVKPANRRDQAYSAALEMIDEIWEKFDPEKYGQALAYSFINPDEMNEVVQICKQTDSENQLPDFTCDEKTVAWKPFIRQALERLVTSVSGTEPEPKFPQRTEAQAKLITEQAARIGELEAELTDEKAARKRAEKGKLKDEEIETIAEKAVANLSEESITWLSRQEGEWKEALIEMVRILEQTKNPIKAFFKVWGLIDRVTEEAVDRSCLIDSDSNETRFANLVAEIAEKIITKPQLILRFSPGTVMKTMACIGKKLVDIAGTETRILTDEEIESIAQRIVEDELPEEDADWLRQQEERVGQYMRAAAKETEKEPSWKTAYSIFNIIGSKHGELLETHLSRPESDYGRVEEICLWLVKRLYNHEDLQGITGASYFKLLAETLKKASALVDSER